jgi:sugar phosphate isomerase/epimerase
MAWTLALNTAPWSDRSLEELAQKAAEWGYPALEITCGTDQFAVQRALSETTYCQQVLDLLERHELRLAALSNRAVGQAVSDRLDGRHQRILPDYVWGDGDPNGVQARAIAEMQATLRVAQQLGVSLLQGATGSPLTHCLLDALPVPKTMIDEGYQQFAQRWLPILQTCRETGVRFAAEVRPGQMAFDLYSAERTLKALQGHESFGFAVNPAHLHWQGVDPVEFLRAFPERIFAVVACDAAVTLNGRSGILGSHLPPGDSRRGWASRCPGHGGVDWPALIRALHEIGFDGPLSVLIDDPGMDRDYAAADAASFLRRLDFLPAPRTAETAFGELG